MTTSRARRVAALAVLGAGMAPEMPYAQETAPPAETAAQRLIRQAVNGGPVGRPESMTEVPAAPGWRNPGDPSIDRPRTPAVVASPPVAPAAADAQRLEDRAAALGPGEFLWMPERQASGEMVLVVSLAEQKTYVYRGGTLIGVSTASTGMASHPTPTGRFTILQKRRQHFSSLYDNAPMPNMLRLTWDGIAFHAGRLPGYPDSHGCIRLPMAFSRHLFAATPLGGRVHIIAEAPPSAVEALAYAAAAEGLAGTR